MPKISLPLAVVSLALITVACSSGAASPSASPPPTASPEPAGIEHPTGSTDIVLRMEEGGGFVPIEFNASNAPLFTLYGDGRIVFQQVQENFFPEPGADGIVRYAPWRTAQLDAGQIEELLTFALAKGGLGAARDEYVANGIADAPNTIFTVNGGGVKKVVTVNALGMDAMGGADDAARDQFKLLADRLRDFDAGGTISSDVYAPTGYRGILIERETEPGVEQPATVDWPWPDLAIDDFTFDINGVGAIQLPHRVMTSEEVAALSSGEVAGGIQGPMLKGPDDKTYSFILRPLLPDEKE